LRRLSDRMTSTEVHWLYPENQGVQHENFLLNVVVSVANRRLQRESTDGGSLCCTIHWWLTTPKSRA